MTERKTVTREGLAALRALSDAATPGPWNVGCAQDYVTYDGECWPQVWSTAPVADVNGRPGAKHKDAADAAFIVAAVNYVRAALTALPESADEGLREAAREDVAALDDA